MGALVASPGNFPTAWFASESTFIATYTGSIFGAVPAVSGNTAVSTTFDSGSGPWPIGYDVMDYFTAGGAEFTAFGKTLTTPLSGNRRTAYLRTTFTVPFGGLTNVQMRYLMDDGGFIYLDGALLCTVNMAAGTTDIYSQNAANSTTTEAFLRTVDLGVAGAVSGGNAVVKTALSFLAPGNHTLAVSVRSNATDSSDLCLALELTAAPDWAIHTTGSIASSADDAEESATGTVNLVSTSLDLLNDSASGVGDQPVGLRFTGLAIPPGALITSATIQFKADQIHSEATALDIAAEAADSAPAFTSDAGNWSSCSFTNMSVPWQPAAWAAVGDATVAQRTPNLAAIVQESVSRPGWTSGNAIAFLVERSGHSAADSFDKGGGSPASLSVTYSSVATASFAHWLTSHPTLSGVNATRTANPDGDGFNNLLEYALRTNPTQSNTAPYILSREGGNLVFTYTRPSVATDLVYSVEWSESLSGGNWSTAGISQQILADDGTTRTVRAYTSTTGAQLYMRLKVVPQ